MTEVALEVRNLEVHGRRPIVEGVNIAIHSGSVVALVGESGSGKTVTSRAVLGLLPTTLNASGQVTIAGEEQTAEAQPILRRALGRTSAVVFQNPQSMFDPLMRIGDQIVEGRSLKAQRHQAAERARVLLAELGFSDPSAVTRLYPHQLSGGMAQRAALAMAMMPEPKLLVVDEPTSALDATLRLEAMRSIRMLASSGTGVLFITHDMKLVKDFSDQVLILYAGRVMESGATASLLRSPTHPYTQALVACSTAEATRQGVMPSIPGIPARAGEAGDSCPFAGRCPDTHGRCTSERPRLRRVAGRTAACHLVDRQVP